ncbi:hypothetical protein [Leucobacter salsicius]|uniref:hypothetical protein n=1 Tax=Leucobacter salsicius TaxID=664638 RepID=UPI0012FC6AC9|nr:hypothetical protein [Leucobacter salsicius]
MSEHFAAGGGVLFGTFTISSSPAFSPVGFSSQEIGLRSLKQYKEIKALSAKKADEKAMIQKLRDDFERVAEVDTWAKGWKIASQLEAVRYALQRMFAGNVWSRESKQLGIIGRATSIEVLLTPDANPAVAYTRVQAHIHVHFLLFTEKPLKVPSDVATLKRSLHSRWKRAAEMHGHSSRLTHQQLVIADPVDTAAMKLSSYVTKGSLHDKRPESEEETSPSRSVSMFAPLIESAEAEAIGIEPPRGAETFWKNLEGLLSGLHLYRLTPNLKRAYGVGELRAARKKEASSRIESVEVLAAIDKKEWGKFQQQYPDLVSLIKEAAGGVNAAEQVSEILSTLNLPHLLLQRPQSGPLSSPAGL